MTHPKEVKRPTYKQLELMLDVIADAAKKAEAERDALNALIEGLSKESITIDKDFIVGSLQLIENLKREAATIRGEG